MLERLIQILPRLRSQFGLIGLIVTVGGAISMRTLAPESVKAQIAAGSIGVTLIVFGQVFYFLRLIPPADRARFVLALFAMFCIFMIALVAATAYFALQTTKISDVSVQGDNSGSEARANTLDDLILRWAHSGPDNDCNVTVRQSSDVSLSRAYRVRASDHVLRLPANELKALWPHPQLDSIYPVRIEFQLPDDLQRFGPFEIRTALRIIYFFDDQKLTVAAMTDEQNRIDHYFSAKVMAWPAHPRGADSSPKSVDIQATAGKAMADFHWDSIQMCKR